MDITKPTFRVDQYDWLDKRKKINLESLDEEISEMPELIRICSECLCLANETRDAAKDALLVVKAGIAEVLRNEKTVTGKPKSESTIDSQIPLSPDYAQAVDRLSDARRDAGLWDAMMSALHTKSANLRNAVDLITSGYMTRDFIVAKYRQQIRDVKKA